MGVPTTTMHTKSDSEVTSIGASSPPHSPPQQRRLNFPMYYVQSPSQHDAEKMSYGSSPLGSPHHYHCSPIHHSRESSTSRTFSASLKNPLYRHSAVVPWKKISRGENDGDGVEDDGDDCGGGGRNSGRSGGGIGGLRLYLCSVLGFAVMFFVFGLILWGSSKAYKPRIFVKHIVFHSFDIQAGMDKMGVPTDMLSINSTVRITYRNRATFFGVHVSSTPTELYYYQLKIASGQMKKFYESRKSDRDVVTMVLGHQVPLYGGVSVLGGASASTDHLQSVQVPLNLTFRVRSRALILGELVKSKFYETVRCSVTLRGNKLGKVNNLTHSCNYH